MPERTPCKWKRFDRPDRSVCEVCKGHIHINRIDHCPYHINGVPRAKFQHLITAEERFASIRLMKAMEVVEERKRNRGLTHGKET